jgi:hypothetical protein
VEWNAFSLNNAQATCLLCGHIVKPNPEDTISSSSLSRHLAAHNVSEDFQALILPGSRSDVESRDSSVLSTTKKRVVTQLAFPTPVTVPTTTITAALLDVIVFGMLPFTFAENPALQRLLHLFQPSYKVPHRTTFSRKAIERYEEVLAEEKALFTVHGTRGVSLQVRVFPY